MDAYVIVGENDSGKSSVTRCLTGSGSGKIRTRPIAKCCGAIINVYVHLSSLQEDYKRIRSPADFVRQVGRENCEAVLFSLWPHGRGGGNKRPDADTYLRYFVDEAGWNVVRVACLGIPVDSITTLLPDCTIRTFPTVEPTPVNEVAARVRCYFNWL